MKNKSFLRKFTSKLTYFDIALGIIFISIVVGFFLFFYRKNQYINIRVKITDQDVLYASTQPQTWYANQFKVGAVERDALGRVVTEITNIETFNVSSNKKAVYLDIKVRAVYDKRTKTYSSKGTNLAFGSTIRFYLSNVTFNALIVEPINLEGREILYQDKTITVLARGANQLNDAQSALNNTTLFLEPEILQKIKVGDTVKDSNGNILMEVTNIKLRPAQRIIQNINGELLLKNDPYYKDAIITLKIKTKELNGELFLLDFIPLKLGEVVPLNFTYTSVFPVLVDIQ